MRAFKKKQQTPKISKEEINDILGKPDKKSSFLLESDFLSIVESDLDYKSLIELSPILHNNKPAFDILKLLTDKIILETYNPDSPILVITKNELMSGENDDIISVSPKVVILDVENNVETSLLFANILVPIHKLLCILEIVFKEKRKDNSITKMEYDLENHFHTLLKVDLSIYDTSELIYNIINKELGYTEDEVNQILSEYDFDIKPLLKKETIQEIISNWFREDTITNQLGLKNSFLATKIIIGFALLYAFIKTSSILIVNNIRTILHYFGVDTSTIPYADLEKPLTEIAPTAIIVFTGFIALIISIFIIKKHCKNRKVVKLNYEPNTSTRV